METLGRAFVVCGVISVGIIVASLLRDHMISIKDKEPINQIKTTDCLMYKFTLAKGYEYYARCEEVIVPKSCKLGEK